MKKKTFPRAAAYAGCAIFALTTAALAQNSDPKDVTVQLRHDSKDSKAPPVTQEQEQFVHFLLEGGYISQYNFRGTNLMPNSDGGGFYQAQATIPKWGLTLGLYGIHQIGTASAETWSVSEGGGGAGVTGSFGGGPGGVPILFQRFPTTIQSSFYEIDLFISYKFSLGPVDVTLGNIAFFIDRKAETFELDIISRTDVGFPGTVPPSRFRTLGPEPTVEDEQFDRIYVRLSTTKLSRHITPSITYYQTIYSEGTQPTSAFITTRNQFGNLVTIGGPGPGGYRNDELGGYLEGRVNGNFPVGKWLDINPYGIVSVSFGDRTEPSAASFTGEPLYGFNHAQAGLELDFHITEHLAFVPFGAYSYHISEPPIGTDRHSFWWGAKVALNF